MKDRSTVIWNKHAYNAGTLLSRHHLPHVLQHRQETRYEGVVGPLNRWVDHIRVSTQESVPYFDPRAAAEGADVLVLLQDPSGEAQLGSGFISRDNNDPTAHNSTLAAEAGGLPYSRSLHWNVVPWWVANPSFAPRSLAAEARRAAPLLAELMDLLETRPKVVLLLGKQAQEAWSQLLLGASPELKGLPIIEAPHPSPLAYNKTDARTGKPNRALLQEAFAQATAVSQTNAV
ncbi:uracil-DNA glycosylase [Pseudarthrobacter sp. WHRI 8279]|uniref:uracil-DNA glycosylase n=1 Tax=Pseudarthrobacter sp. WHRI 8279 TaxID=3162566 RepID=UPI0032EFBCC7